MSLSEEALVKRLREFTGTQESIQSFSGWILFYVKNIDRVVTTWATELRKAPTGRKLLFLYLVNDILHAARRKKEEGVLTAFAKVLPDAFSHVIRKGDKGITPKLEKLTGLWRERHLLPSSTIDMCVQRIASETSASSKKSAPSASAGTARGGSASAAVAAAAAGASGGGGSDVLDADQVIAALQQEGRESALDLATALRADAIHTATAPLLQTDFSSVSDVSQLQDVLQRIGDCSHVLTEHQGRLIQCQSRFEALARLLERTAATVRAAMVALPDQRAQCMIKLQALETARAAAEKRLDSLEPGASARVKRVRSGTETPPRLAPDEATPPLSPVSPEPEPLEPTGARGGDSDAGHLTPAELSRSSAPTPMDVASEAEAETEARPPSEPPSAPAEPAYNPYVPTGGAGVPGLGLVGLPPVVGAAGPGLPGLPGLGSGLPGLPGLGSGLPGLGSGLPGLGGAAPGGRLPGL